MADDIVTRLRDWAACSIDRGRVDAPLDFTEAADEIERLRAELARNADEFRETLTELRQRVETLTAERDQARRELLSEHITPFSEAKRRGWDCFKDDSDAR